ncbi:sigma-70 family RNA polymerase sigma factor [Tenggerimyces flavus]|uniref:Sigma-70 family RNA polymerase sigma factor n=1 Tax=Tenggerimyces flavus TaxID=1708749 RepID=A0ABV7Y7Z0_9ACTN|nr:sigma-70 family RNA polymerase sigma factor [Tenggerimyces flavus]MBM7785365.1 RNA polymerase sigma factor (sigma-70 family) [Tenggerimyces flavus]
MTDERDFTIAFQDLYPRAVRLAARIVGSAAAEDVASEALARAYAQWDRIGSSSYRTGWVLRVATNLAIDAVRSRDRAVELDSDFSALSDEQDAATLRVALIAALRALPLRQREAIALRYLGGLSQAAVAGALGISPGSVAQHIHRGLRVLRGQFTEPLLEEPLRLHSWSEAVALAGTDRLVSARVLEVWKIGWNVDIGIPALLVVRGQSRGHSPDPELLVGQTLEVLVSEVDEARSRVVVTLPVAADEAAAFARRRALIAALQVGEVRTGRVHSILPFGAFVDIGDVHGLVHTSDQHGAALKVGQELEVEIAETKPDFLRVALTLH